MQDSVKHLEEAFCSERLQRQSESFLHPTPGITHPLHHLLKIIVQIPSPPGSHRLLPFLAILTQHLSPETIDSHTCALLITKMLQMQITAKVAVDFNLDKSKVLSFAKPALRKKKLHPLDIFFEFYPDGSFISDSLLSITEDFDTLSLSRLLQIPKFFQLSHIRDPYIVVPILTLTLRDPIKTFRRPGHLAAFMRGTVSFLIYVFFLFLF